MSADRLVARGEFDFDYIVESDYALLQKEFQSLLRLQNEDRHFYPDEHPAVTGYEIMGMDVLDNTVIIHITGLTPH